MYCLQYTRRMYASSESDILDPYYLDNLHFNLTLQLRFNYFNTLVLMFATSLRV